MLLRGRCLNGGGSYLVGRGGLPGTVVQPHRDRSVLR